MDTIMQDRKYLYESCELCANSCHIDRNKHSARCGSSELKVARADLHFWEEPVLSGTNGSGTIFFSGCNLKCVFCQNHNISHERFGKAIDSKRLSDIFRELSDKGAHNINLVTPTHYTPHIIDALDIYRPSIPIVYNTGGYDSLENLKLLNGYIDVYVPDMKYASSELAYKISGIGDYPLHNQAAIQAMIDQVGSPKIVDGLIKKGVIIRHLVLPNHIKDSYEVLDIIASKFKDNVLVSIMSQYMPINMESIADLNRPINKLEYKAVLAHLDKLHIENGFVQELTSSDDKYIPEFNLLGV